MNMKAYGNSYAIVHSDGIIEIGIYFEVAPDEN